MYSFYYFWPLNVRTNIRIHCSLVIKNLRMESLLFLFSKKDKFIFSYTFYKYSELFFFFYFTCSKCKIYFDFELLYISAQIKEDSRALESAQTRERLCCSHTPGSF